MTGYLHVGKVDHGRIYLKSVGFNDGDKVLFLKHDDGIFIMKTDVLGTCVVKDGRAYLGKKVLKELGMSDGDFFAIIEDNFESKLTANLKLVKAKIEVEK